MPQRHRTPWSVALLGVAVFATSACAPGVAPNPSGADPAPSASSAEPVPADAELSRFRTALDGQSPANPAALVEALVAADFDRSTIERTSEVDSLGAPVTFIEVAVRAGHDCLIGQVGDGEPAVQRTAPLGTGRCLVGETVPVD